MANVFAAIEFYLTEVLRYGSAALALWALGDSLYRPVISFTHAEKLTKPGWVLINSLSLVILYFLGSINILGLAAITAVSVYMADVRPAVRGIQRGGSRW